MIKKEEIKRNFSNCAAHYDAYSTVQNSCGLKLIDSIKTNGFSDILDIGCGTGAYTGLLKDRFPDAKIKAVDISQDMIRIAKRKPACRGIDFIVADAEQVSLEEGFDLVSSNASFHWFENLEETLLFYKQALKEGGIVAFSIFGPRTFFELNYCLRQLLAEDIAIASMGFKSKEKIEKTMKVIFKKTSVTEQIVKEEVVSLPELLRKIKYTGTRGAGIRNKGFWTPRMISKLEQIYRKKFGSIIVTYQVFFCQGS